MLLLKEMTLDDKTTFNGEFAFLTVEKPKPLRAGGIKRTSSLDAISGSYLSGQWPRDGGSCGVPCCHKATQVS